MSSKLPLHLDLWQESLHWQPDENQQVLFQQLYEQILIGNQQLNLTRITEPDDFWEKHLWDSLSGLAPWLNDDLSGDLSNDLHDELSEERATGNTDEHDPETVALNQTPDESAATDAPLRVIDIGTGGGFPGVPAAIALSTPSAPVDLTLVDSTRKKIQFLQTLCQTLNLPANCLAIRAEALGQDPTHREQYDLALIRAVGKTATCAEYVLPFLKVGGQAVIYRGQWSTDDTEAIIPVIDLLGGELTDLQNWRTPITQGERHCLFIYKEQPTPDDLPRAVGVPGKTPLN
ncbi:MAG: 16S rRNA (guanine(527)-N(7))-methyltransferase RsmG [Cyanobacteria bacterium J06621_11]